MVKYNLEGNGVFANLFLDEAFKRAFVKYNNKKFLIELLNSLIDDENIVDLEFLPIEVFGIDHGDRKVIYDMYCKTDKGYFVQVELQNNKQTHIISRILYYGASQLINQGIKGDWDYQLKKCYVILLANFVMFNEKENVVTHAVLYDTQNHIKISDKIHQIIVESPKLVQKGLENCKNDQEIWIWLIRHAHLLDEIPAKLKGTIFEEFLIEVKLSIFTEEERTKYEADMITAKDVKNFTDYSFNEGKSEGVAEGKTEGIAEGEAKMVKLMHKKGSTVEQISELTGYSIDKINELLKF